MPEEKVFYNKGGVKVTTSVFSVGSKSYRTSSIKKTAVRRVPADKAIPYMAVAFGIALLIWGFGVRTPVGVLVGVSLILIGGYHLLRSEDRFEFYVTTNRGTEKVLENVVNPVQLGELEKALKEAVFEATGLHI